MPGLILELRHPFLATNPMIPAFPRRSGAEGRPPCAARHVSMEGAARDDAAHLMHRIAPARLKPGVSRTDIDRGSSAGRRAASDRPGLVRGRALIVWDLKVPGRRKKLDAIDTDQITPAA